MMSRKYLRNVGLEKKEVFLFNYNFYYLIGYREIKY